MRVSRRSFIRFPPRSSQPGLHEAFVEIAGEELVHDLLIVKELFGGLGYNIWNPALAARAFLLASWPTSIPTAPAAPSKWPIIDLVEPTARDAA